MSEVEPFVDIHCHLLPGIDDGAGSTEVSLEMARMAVADGFRTIIATPHQLGNFSKNHGDDIRRRTVELQHCLDRGGIALRVLPGGDVRIEPELVAKIAQGEVLSLADHRRHVLLELPHELYVPLEPILEELGRAALVGILSHPERNHGILHNARLCEPLVDAGCLMQITAGSLMGTFGPESQRLAEWMLGAGLVHFVATDAHGPRNRRPLMRRAFDRVVELTDHSTATELCCGNPACVAEGADVASGRRRTKRVGLARWLGWKKAG